MPINKEKTGIVCSNADVILNLVEELELLKQAIIDGNIDPTVIANIESAVQTISEDQKKIFFNNVNSVLCDGGTTAINRLVEIASKSDLILTNIIDSINKLIEIRDNDLINSGSTNLTLAVGQEYILDSHNASGIMSFCVSFSNALGTASYTKSYSIDGTNYIDTTAVVAFSNNTLTNIGTYAFRYLKLKVSASTDPTNIAFLIWSRGK